MKAVELSALREEELEPLVNALDDLDLSAFSYIGFHAPSRFPKEHEARVVELLKTIRDRGWPIVVHPDVIVEPSLWKGFGELLCIENMDMRKSDGRSCAQLSRWFEEFPEATFCLDLGHARQVDPSMTEAHFLLKNFRDRLRQIHLSEVTTSSSHVRLSWGAISAMRQVATRIDPSIPIILESVIAEDEVAAEVKRARRTFTPQGTRADTISESPLALG